MPSKNYALQAGGPERVSLIWEGAYKNLSITLDGVSIGSFETSKELETPQSLPLPGGSRLGVVLAKAPFPELRLTHDGEPLPGSAGDPHTQLENAANMILAIAALNAILGLIAALGDITFLKALGAGWASVFTGAVYAGLAGLVKKRSTMALGAAVSLFILDGLYMFVAAAAVKATPPIGGVIARLIFLAPMLRGFGAIRELNKPPQPRRRRDTPTAASAQTLRPTNATVPAARPPMPKVSTPVPAPSVAKTLSGDAERLRLKMSEKNTTSAPISALGRKIDTKAPLGVDAARKSLRFIAHRCEIGEAGLKVTLPSGEVRGVPFDQIVRIVARQLPPDPPWDGALILDIVPSPTVLPEPIRIFGTTMVNYAAIPGGSTTRLDNTRRLTAFLRDHCRRATLDAATEEFVRGPKVPPRFVNMTQFIEYDATYG